MLASRSNHHPSFLPRPRHPSYPKKDEKRGVKESFKEKVKVNLL